jgi:hypothetical protein
MKKAFYIFVICLIFSVPALAKGCHMGGKWSSANSAVQNFSTSYSIEDTLYVPYQDSSIDLQLYWTDCTTYDLPYISIMSILDPQLIRHSSSDGHFNLTASGEYQIEEFIAVNYYGLKAKFYVAFMTPPVTTGITENESGNISVYPNPFGDVMNIKLGDKNVEELQVRIFSLDGRLVLEHTYNDVSGCTLYTSALNPGMYIIEIRTKENLLRQKLLKTGS